MSQTPKTSRIISGYRASCARAIKKNPENEQAIREDYEKRIKLVMKGAGMSGSLRKRGSRTSFDCTEENVLFRIAVKPDFDYYVLAIDKNSGKPSIIPIIPIIPVNLNKEG